MRSGGAHDLIAQESARDADVVDLRVFAQRVVQLRVAVLDEGAQCVKFNALVTSDLVHAVDELVQAVRDDPVDAMVHKRLDCHVRAGTQLAGELPEFLVREIRVLLRAGEDELFIRDSLVEHEPGIAVAGAADMRERGQVVGAGEQVGGQALALRVEPEAGRSRDNADAVAGSDGIPVGHAFRVVPHAVRVDQVGVGRSRDVDAPAIHVRRHAGDHVFRARSPAILRPHFADLV